MSARRPDSARRPEIEGLRGLAVVSVCLFHAGVPGLAGGFAGVDVFFVISGYLTTLSLARERGVTAFPALGFYERRARRILPALFTLLSCSAGLAALVVPPKLLRDFGLSLVAATSLCSNVAFWWKSSSYFEAPSEWDPLLHTWSLGIEAQFYLLLPLLLGLSFRFAPKRGWLWLAAGSILSFGVGLWATFRAPTAAFYLLPARAWELLVGASLALAPAELVGAARRHFGSGLTALGLVFVLASMLGLDRESPFPGALAGVPCAGAWLVLAGGSSTLHGRPVAASRLLALPLLRWFGKISFSLYLWHFPLLVFFGKYQLWGAAGVAAKAIALGLSVVLAWLSWRWVEQPPQLAQWRGKRLGSFALAGAGALALSGALLVRSGGWPGRFPRLAEVSLAQQLATEARDADVRRFENGRCFVTRADDFRADACLLQQGAQKNALLWGDSFAARYAYGFAKATHVGFNTFEYTSPQCPPILGYRAASRPACTAFNERALALLAEHQIEAVFLAANWSAYLGRRKLGLSEIAATVRALQARKIQVVLIGQSPVFSFVYPDEYFFQTFGPAHDANADYSAPLALDLNLNERLKQAAKPDFFFDPLRTFCAGLRCRFKRGESYLFVDYGHYSHAGSLEAVSALSQALSH